MAFNLVDIDFYGVKEIHNSYNFNSQAGQNGEDREIELNYIILGSPDSTSAYYFATDTAAKNFFRNWFIDVFGSPVSFSGLPLKAWRFEATETPLKWQASLSFGFQDTNDDEQQHSKTPAADLSSVIVGVSDLNWNFSTTNVNIKNTLQTVAGWSSYAREVPEGGGDSRFTFTREVSGGATQGETGGTITHLEYIMRDFGGRLAVDSDGVAEGVDVLRPTCSFNITCRIFPTTPFNPLTIMQHVGTVNAAVWGGVFNPREVLFVGCDIKRVADSVPDTSGNNNKKWLTEIVFNFQYMPSVYYPTPDGQQILKRGFDVLWQYQTPTFDPETKTTSSKTMQVNIERVYPVADFAEVFPWTWSA